MIFCRVFPRNFTSIRFLSTTRSSTLAYFARRTHFLFNTSDLVNLRQLWICCSLLKDYPYIPDSLLTYLLISYGFFTNLLFPHTLDSMSYSHTIFTTNRQETSKNHILNHNKWFVLIQNHISNQKLPFFSV